MYSSIWLLRFPLGRLVDGELDLPRAVRHDLGHERRVLRLDLVVAEVEDVRHPEDPLVELDPLIHPAELDVAHDVVDASPGRRPCARGRSTRRRRTRAGRPLRTAERSTNVWIVSP